MKKIAPITIVAIVVIAGLLLIFFGSYGPSQKDIVHRLTPVIIPKAQTNAFVVEASGDPNATAGAAFSMLMSAYFKVKGAPKGPHMEAPRARWPKPLETPKEQWTGIYAIPVPETVTTIPEVKRKNGLTLELREWKYGEVAEILHIGPYATEDTSVAKLKKFIAEKGYEICGPHEEEYLKSSGLLPVSPKKYLTIIRYQVCRIMHQD